MNTYAQAGQRIADRFDLLYPYEHQPSDQASVWVALDVVLSRHVRAIVVDPDSPRAQPTIDAAHRASLVADPHLVSIVQVDSEDLAIITEIPPGSPVSQHLIGTPLPPEQVASIIGEAASAIATAARRGVRHLHCTGRTIFLTPEGDVIVDGLGVFGALAGADTSKDRADLDRDEARGLSVLCASLLLGHDFPEPSEHDSAIYEARQLDLPPVLDSLLTRETEGQGATSPADLTRSLVPWHAIDVAALPGKANDAATAADGIPPVTAPKTRPQWPALKPEAIDAHEEEVGAEGVGAVETADEPAEELAGEPATIEIVAADIENEAEDAGAEGAAADIEEPAAAEPEPVHQPAETKAEAAQVVDDALGLDGDAKLSSPIAWPDLSHEPEGPATEAFSPEEAQTAVMPAEESAAELEADVVDEGDKSQVDREPESVVPEAKSGPKRVSVLEGEVTEPERITRTAMAARAAEPAARPDPKPAGAPLAKSATKPTPKPALTEYEREREKKFDVSKVVLPLFAVGIVFFGWLGLKTLTAPVAPVTLVDPDTNVPSTEEPSATAEPTAEPSPTPTVAPAIAAAELVSPDAGLLRGTDPATLDNPSIVPLAVDGNPETEWESWTYGSPDMYTMSGIGLYVELEQEATVAEVTIDTVGNTGGNIQIRDTVKDAPSAGKVLAEGPADGSTTFTLSEPLTGTSFVIWMTELPLNSAGEPQMIVSEIHVK